MLLPKKDATLIPISDIQKNSRLSNLSFIDFEKNSEERQNFDNEKYEFQRSQNVICLTGLLTVRGDAKSTTHKKIAFSSTITLREFIHTIKYDPATPPLDTDFQYGKMKAFHDKSQADFKSAKRKNRDSFCQYMLEGLRGERDLNLPFITAWQDEDSFKETVFVCLQESSDGVYYGKLYIPIIYTMQSDGQTQTAAAFLLSRNEEAVEKLDALNRLRLSIDLELNADIMTAKQSFADRNGRGVKKDKNLVIEMDVSAPLSQLRENVISGTMFDGRIAGAKSGNISETSTSCIMNLSTLEQTFMHVIVGGIGGKSEDIKHYHINLLTPIIEKFVKTFQHCFKDHYPMNTLKNDDPFRKKLLTGWPFIIKGIANAFHDANLEDIKPITEAMKSSTFNYLSEGLTSEDTNKMDASELFLVRVNHYKKYLEIKNVISNDELIKRLKAINWNRHAKHWIKEFGSGKDRKTGNPLTHKLKSLPYPVVKGSKPHNAISISRVASIITSDDWKRYIDPKNAVISSNEKMI